MTPRLAPFGARAAAGFGLVSALAGCSVFKSNEEAQAVLTQRVADMPAGNFFDTFGRAKRRDELADGMVAYYWESSTGPVPPGPTGLDERVCKLNLVVRKNGRIESATIVQDNPGRLSTSRCSEIFKAR